MPSIIAKSRLDVKKVGYRDQVNAQIHIAVLSAMVSNGDLYAVVVDGQTVSTHKTAAEAIKAQEKLAIPRGFPPILPALYWTCYD